MIVNMSPASRSHSSRTFPTRWFRWLHLVLLPVLLTGCISSGKAAEIPLENRLAVPATSIPPALQPLRPTFTAAVFDLKPTSTPLPTWTPLPTGQVTGYGPSGFPPEINPLTGLEAEQRENLERRPLAIKVTNFPRSVRPQWGLTLADHVYEYYMETGLTRFIAVFYGRNAERVGPVRSGRFFDEHVIRMYKAILAFASADYRVLDVWADKESDIRNYLVLERPDNCPPLCRIGSDKQYNTLYADTQALSRHISERGTSNTRQSLDGFRFEKTMPFRGLDGERIDLRFSRISYHRWEYDPVTRRYLRFQEAAEDDEGPAVYEPLTDSLTGEQIAADNLVVLFMPYVQLTSTTDTEVYQVDFIGQGEGVAFREGRAIPLTWSRAGAEALPTLTTTQGRLHSLKPGNVWFEIMGVGSQGGQQPDGSWFYDFHTP